MRRALELRGVIAIVIVIASGCSLTHDLEGFVDVGAGGAGGAMTSALTATAASGPTTSAASTSSSVSASTVASSSSGCTPKTCAEISPTYTLADDGCGAPLVCGCDQGSAPNPATGQCECSTALVASPVVYPAHANELRANHQNWTDEPNITIGMSGSAVSSLDSGQVTNYLQARGYALGLPAGARVKKIHAKICVRQTAGGVRDEHVRLLFDFQATGQDAKRDQNWPGGTSCTPRSYDWPVAPNTTLLDYDASVFQGPGFGVEIMAGNNGQNTSNVHVGYMTISVDYLPACTAHAF